MSYVTCGKCGATWTGLRIEHCTQCHQTFTGSTAGDMHRTGDHAISEGPDRRRCLTVQEMAEKGMAPNERGVWTTGKAAATWWKPVDVEVIEETNREYVFNGDEADEVWRDRP